MKFAGFIAVVFMGFSSSSLAAEFSGSCQFGHADPENVVTVDGRGLSSTQDFEQALSEVSTVIIDSSQSSEKVPLTIAIENYELLKQKHELNSQVMTLVQNLELSYKNLQICIVKK